ncbi:aminopeptidase [Micavibrio aeruginosavorus]|uniref:aminopeptidase n=1 Tax=Micavibrio aeruginosavorus TaxID=349221 RepID=UPI003F4A93BD
MKIQSLGPYYKDQIKTIKALAKGSSLWKAEAAALLPRIDQSYKRTDADALLSTLSDMQRLAYIVAAGLEHESSFRADLKDMQAGGWATFTAPPVEDKLNLSLAKKLYNGKPGNNDIVTMRLGDTSRAIGPYLVQWCLRDKVPFSVYFQDSDFHALLVNHATPEGVKALGADYMAMVDGVNKSMIVRANTPNRKIVHANPDKAKIYDNETALFFQKSGTGEVFYTLTCIPTENDSKIDGIPYNDYIKLFFEMCDQPWDAISDAHLKLIQEFNTATHVRITNNDGTDVSMELVDDDGSHFTFCNSLIAKNVPGSEIFSAPRKNSVNGIVVAKGKFTHGGALIEDLTMEFKNGELVKYEAKTGLEAFKRAVEMDDGARFVGELGIGTNPHLKQHVANGLLVEKIGGSFHLALGRPYSYTEYQGTKVKVDNGGRSKLHWDITTMLYGKDGIIYLDGRKVMENGLWIAPQYDVLNRGWAALPRKDRPAYWKSYDPKL